MNTSLPIDPDTRAPLLARVGAADLATVAAESAVSWGAIIAGATGAAALSLILLMLGTGLGLSSVSPWAGHGASAVVVGVSAIAWLTFTQLASSGMGGYLAGRLRSKWTLVHTDEVYFRDTAHGFLAWALSTVVTAAFLASAISSIVGQGVETGATVIGGTATAAVAGVGAMAAERDTPSAGQSIGFGYYVDSLFRKDASAGDATTPTALNSEPMPAASSAEVVRIFANGLRSGLTPDDTRHVAQLIVQRTGMSQADAEQRVTQTFASIQSKLKAAEASAREAADKARKASAGTALWLFVTLLVGAFVASLAATYGGRRRDL